MRIDRAEAAGTGAALLLHLAVIAALSLSLAHVAKVPEPPAMEVEFVDNVGLAPAAPTAAPTPPPQEQAPDVAPLPDPAAPVPVLAPAPSPAPVPAPRPLPRISPSPPAKPAPPVARPTPPRASRLGADFLKGIASPSPAAAPARPSAPTVSASAMAGIAQAIRRQVQPCADRQINPGPGASAIKVKLNVRLFPNGALKGRPQVIGTSGVTDDNARFEQRVKDLAVAAFTGCAPLTGLPQEFYANGWSNINLTYNLP
ncbi:cell envelope biogenesis protein TolA [Sphingomonas sp. ASV193]|uniref:cell envelope biogenesis protein TolA n=1 Tax=Sphingomonas sp. ASV193 TaxID=3144405 RepID=UPI0032E8809A